MLQKETIVKVTDNSGAKKLRVIGLPGNSRKRFAKLGEIIVGAVHGAQPGGIISNRQIVTAVIVRTRKERRRADGSYIRFDDNACVILQSKEVKDPKGTRIFGPIAKEVKEAGFNKIASLAEELY